VITYERQSDYNGGSRERGVDGALAVYGMEAIIKHKPDILVLLSGDFDMRSLIEKAKEYGCRVHIWSFRSSLSFELKRVGYEIYIIDDHLDDFIFLSVSRRPHRDAPGVQCSS